MRSITLGLLGKTGGEKAEDIGARGYGGWP
jgi:hypothetical protein